MNHRRINIFEKLSHFATIFSGTTKAFITACLVILIWLLTGPLFHFSDTWQLVINTGTTIITFLMVFLIQRMQNKDSHAIHLKLNELIASLQGPSNRLIDVENLSEKDLELLKMHYGKISKNSEDESDIKKVHSIEEAIDKHNITFSTK